MHPLFAFGMPGLPELLIILLVVVVLFGAKRLPELARGLGSSLKEFRKGRDEADQELKPTAEETAARAAAKRDALPPVSDPPETLKRS
jgi:sec-independent protein translocase protein TatA